MAKPVRFTPKKTESGWRVNIPPKYSQSGKRERHFYPTLEKAKNATVDLKAKVLEFGRQTRAISPSLAEQATAAEALLAPYGITILEAARRIAGQEQSLTTSVEMGTALDAFIAAKSEKSLKQVQAIRHMAAHLRTDFTGRKISSITAAEISVHLSTRTSGNGAFNAKIRLMVTLWRWCAKPPREWCQADILTHIERKESVSSEIGILSAIDAAKLMTAAEKFYPETVPAFAIALFTGMRQREIERLTPNDITSNGIEVPAASSKTKRRRFIQMPLPLQIWLKHYPIGETVCPSNWSRKERAVRRLAGWKVWSDLVPSLNLPHQLIAEPDEDAPLWPQNALRHTAASVALAIGKSLEILIFEHGHAGGVEMLRRHYIGKMPKKEAHIIWGLKPTIAQ